MEFCPDFQELERVLERQVPSRPVLFEFMIGDGTLQHFLAEGGDPAAGGPLDLAARFRAHALAGYDFACVHAGAFRFPWGEQSSARTVSQNEGAVILDRASLDAYPWPDPNAFDLAPFRDTLASMPSGMKAIVCSPCGILENVVALAGFESLCMMLYDEPGMAADLFEQVGSRILGYFRRALEVPGVGALMCNDDWGFKTQTMIPPESLRSLVFPWYRRIVAMAHGKGVHALLHSCGNNRDIVDDILLDMRFDGLHSFEDNIQPVEEAYSRLKGRIAILGGLDVGFLVEGPPEAIRTRAEDMLDLAADDGGYALGSGNSIADFVPFEHVRAMIEPALDRRRQVRAEVLHAGR